MNQPSNSLRSKHQTEFSESEIDWPCDESATSFSISNYHENNCLEDENDQVKNENGKVENENDKVENENDKIENYVVPNRKPTIENDMSCASRPTSLFASQLTVNAPCPEFSISPADSLSKASSSEIAAESSNVDVVQLRSPTSLSVNYNPSGSSGNFLSNYTSVLAPSYSFTSLQQGNSLASSINDLTVEAEQLERAIRHNDIRFVQRMLELHHTKFPVNLNNSIFDKSSHGSRLSNFGISQPDISKSQTNLDAVSSNERKESSSTIEPGGESPSIFTNSLHLAIENNAYDVVVLLLKYGIDPNEPGVNPDGIDSWRRSSHASDESAPLQNNNDNKLTINNLLLINSSSREPLIPSSYRSTNSPNLLSPISGTSHFNTNLNINNANQPMNVPSIYFALNSSPSSVNSDLSSIGRYSTPTKMIHIRSDLDSNLKIVHVNQNGNSISYEDEYTRENLYSLAPIFLAVTLNNAPIVRELIHYGANVNVCDRHQVTPLHLILCQQHISRSCLTLLIQNGAKVTWKNLHGIAPYHFTDNKNEIIQLQKCIIDNAFAQIVPQQSSVSNSFISSNNINNVNNNNNNNNSTTLTPVYSFGNEEVISTSYFGHGKDTKDPTAQSSNYKGNTASGIIKKFQSKGKDKSKKELYICLDNTSRVSADGPTNNSFSGSVQSDVESSGACKKSIAGDSIAHSLGPQDDDSPISPPFPSQISQKEQTSGSGSRFFGRKKSGDENMATAFSFIKMGKSSNKSHQANANLTNERNETFFNRAESSVKILIKMSSNFECVPFILTNLQKFLSSIISICEQSTVGSKLYKPITKLLNRILQTIVEELCEWKDKTHSISAVNCMNSIKDNKILDNKTKEELARQLCGLLRSAIHCLQAGQALQYTALLLINKIIDVCIVYGVAQYQCLFFEINENARSVKPGRTTVNSKETKNKTHSIGSSKKHGGSKQSSFPYGNDKSSNSHSSLKENHDIELNVNNKQQEKNNQSSSINSSPCKGFPKDGKTLWHNLMRSKANRDINNAAFLSDVKPTDDKAKKRVGQQIQQQQQQQQQHEQDASSNNRKSSMLSILSNEAVDLILNVLNNAITLHKRVTGSKHSCTPSRRLRQCTYHCLQILSARALLYASQNEDAQKKLTREGPLKVLVTSLDSTHEPQLLSLTLQIVATLALNPVYHAILIQTEMIDSLMQLILPSDEWYYTNHSTKYAKYVKHQAARILVYLGLDKRLRNKVYLFDLLEEEWSQHTPAFDSEEDYYIMKTSLAPTCVYSPKDNQVIGCSIEGMILEILKQIENKIIRGEDNDCSDNLCDDFYYFYGTDARYRSSINPEIHVDLATGTHDENKLNTFFYLASFPSVLKPIIILRLLKHRMFGSVQFWAWPSNAVSRSSVASESGRSYENRSRASSTSNAAADLDSLRSRRNVNLTINCSTSSLLPSRVDIERRTSLKGFIDTRVIIQTTVPIKSIPLSMAQKNQSNHTSQNYQKKPLTDPTIQQIQSQSKDNTPVTSPDHKRKPFHLSSLKRRKLSMSADYASTVNTPEKNEAEIVAFQKELQNLPRHEASPIPSDAFPSNGLAYYSSAIASYIREALEKTLTPAFSRPRSCSVPRVNFDSNSLQLPINHKSPSNSPLIRSATTEGSVCNVMPSVISSSKSPCHSLSPQNLGPQPIVSSESPASGSGRSTSACHVVSDPIMPNTHRAILRVIQDWVRLCSNDFKENKIILKELKDFIKKISLLGQQYQWFAEEISVLAGIQDTNFGDENQNIDAATNKEYNMLKQLVVNGDLPCSKEEAAILAGIQLRIEETWPDTSEKINQSTNVYQITAARQSLNSEKLKPICEDVKETSPVESVERVAHLRMSSSPLKEFRGSETTIFNNGESSCGTSVLSSGFFPSVSGVTKRTTSILCNWVTSNWANRETHSSSAINLRECLPPMYHNSKNMGKTIKEQKRKLFHSPIYESEQQLKKLYIQTCKRLPAYGCKVFQVKELLRGKTKRRATRLLGIGLERIVLLDSKTLTPAKSQATTNLLQWRTGGGRSHDRLILEFRGTKWSFITPSQGLLKTIGTVLWEIMQDLDARFLEEHIITSRDQLDFECQRIYRHDFTYGFDRTMHFREELQKLESILHFPEEVAFRLIQVEYDLFYGVSPVYYIRHVTIALNGEMVMASDENSTNENVLTVKELVERFNEVSSWVTHLIISQPTHEMRKAILSCIMRVAQTCWNLGNFNSAVEILAGLNSEKLKPFRLSISEKDHPVLMEKLTNALLSMSEPSHEYKAAVRRALDIPYSKVIPFFGTFLRDLRYILQGMPSLVVLPVDSDKNDQIKLEFISDYNGEDHYMSRIGVGGIISIEKMKKTHQVLDNIRTFHLHSHNRHQLLSDLNQDSPISSWHQTSLSIVTNKKKDTNQENNSLYEIDIDSYCPIQPLINSHGVSFVPIHSSSFDLHILQSMHHGTTVIHYEEDTSRSSIVYLQLEQSNSILVWSKPTWSSAIKTSAGSPQDYNLSYDIEGTVLPGIVTKYDCKEPAITSLDEGYIDLLYVKDIMVSQNNFDLTSIARRHGLPDNELVDERKCTIRLLFGTNLSDNRTIEFIAPKSTFTIWFEGLKSLIRLIHQQKILIDQRILWLKEKYLQLYYQDSSCAGPTPAEAIKIFGGRKWTLDAMGTSCQSSTIDLSAGKHASTFAVGKAMQGIRKNKKSSISLVGLARDSSPRSHNSTSSDVEINLKSHQSPSKVKKIAIRSSPQMPIRNDQNIDERADSQSSFSYNSCSSCENMNRLSESPPVHTNSLTHYYREKFRRNKSNESDSKHSFTKSAITHSSQMDFIEFMELFRSFLVRLRRDIKDLFEQIASKGDIHSFSEQESNNKDSNQSPASSSTDSHDNKLLGLLTRNTPFDFDEANHQRIKICDAIAAASIVSNCAGVDTLKTLLLTANDFHAFLVTYQGEDFSLEEVQNLIQTFEPDPVIKKKNCLSFEGFARYLMDKDNFAYEPELLEIHQDEMNEPLSHYYMASSHNTYLTGHQLKGESSVELYSQVLLTGCRCVELDCWDGDDGYPVIYHGHTLTSKIPFKKVVETINEKAFAASPYPVILSLENHCSMQQQVKMAQMFLTTFGDKLITKFLFDSDYSDEPQLPSPNQLKYRILIKNKKLRAQLTPAINMKLRASTIAKASGRTNSLISTASTGSLNEEEDDEYDDEDDDEEGLEYSPSTTTNIDQTQSTELQSITKTPAFRTESLSSQEYGSTYSDQKTGKSIGLSSPGIGSRPRSQNEEQKYEDESVGPMLFPHGKVVKSSSQIAPELSDLVIYCQAIKFRGFISHVGSPTNSSMPPQAAIKKIPTRKTLASNPTFNTSSNQLPVCDYKIENRELMSPSPIPSTTSSSIFSNRRPVVSAPCYQVSSINENTAKKLCRKSPLSLIGHTESQLMRTYPAGMRIDSSNFNPIIFWAFGIQSVAMNYQTVDSALHINTAMFEQNGRCGVVLKPAVMRNKSHMMYGRFNPWDKEFDGLHAVNFTITIISGQYVCPNTNIGSPQVDVEIVGIPVDCKRERTKSVARNSLNPIWNESFLFRVSFRDLAFLRFTVTDATTNHVTAQRVIPFNCLKQGYRHLRLRNPQNQSLPLSTLFIYSSWEEEGMEFSLGIGDDSVNGSAQLKNKKLRKNVISSIDLTRLDKDIVGSVPVRRRMFFLVVYGVVSDEPSTILKITQDSTASDVIAQALAKANKPQDDKRDYVLIEEVNRGWEKRHLIDRNATTQRILDPDEKPLEAQSQWKGNGRFVLKKLADDPSTRAWMTTIRTAYTQKEKQKRQENLNSNDELNSEWNDEPEDTFLVCIYNVSPDQPYTILKAPTSSTSQAIIAQALLKARRLEDPREFVIVEELEYFSDTNSDVVSGSKVKNKIGGWRRVLDDDENVYLAQAEWKTKGKFELKHRDDVTGSDMSVLTQTTISRLTRAKGSLKKLSQLRASSKRNKSRVMNTRDEAQSYFKATNARSESYGSKERSNSAVRQVHSEGELPSDNEDKKIVSSISKLKKLSFRKLKVWR